MMRILIAIIAVVVGLIIGIMSNWWIVMINLSMYPLPDGYTFDSLLQPENKDVLIDWVKSLPQSAFILVLVAHLSQAFIGGFVAALISRQHAMCVAMIVGVITLIGGVINILMLPPRVWLWIEMPLYLVLAWFAARLVLKLTAKSAGVKNCSIFCCY